MSVVAALVPEIQPEAYLDRFRQRAWDLFRDWLYDEVPADSQEEACFHWFSFDLKDESALYNPLPIYWNRGLAAVSSLRNVEDSVVSLAYQRFLKGFDTLFAALREALQ